ncbi:cation-transporting P-type ATPase, partial [Micrococcus sp. SIMBA_144]
RNQPTVTAVLAAPGITAAQVLGWAAARAQHSTHPLAAASTAATPDPPAAEGGPEPAGRRGPGPRGAAPGPGGRPRRRAAGP